MKHWLTAGAVALFVLGCGGDTTGNDDDNTPQVTPAPANVQAVIVNGNIELTWDSVPGATSYRVYMASESGVKKANVQQLLNNMFHPGLSDDGFDHPPGLESGLQYFLVVTAVGPNGESTESCEVAAKIGTAFGGSC